jgi:hypothetical protein
MTICASLHRLQAPNIRAAFFTLVCMGFVGMATAQDATTVPRVRSSSPAVLAALGFGSEHSPILRSLVNRIDATDGIVYVEEGTCGHGVRACLLMLVTVAGPHRVLYIRVDPRKAAGCSLVSAIGHELYHAIEVLSEASVRSSHMMFALFERLGPRVSGRFETKAALRTGLDVEREACRQQR